MENNENQRSTPEIEENQRVEAPTLKNKLLKLTKKWWFWAIIGVLLIALIAGSGDDSNNSANQTCTHSYILETTEATCTSGGYDTYKCTLCSKTKKEYKSSLGHTTNEGTCSRCGESFGTWKTTFYVDEFNNPTNEAYIKNNNYFYGTFSNSATTNSKLYALILIDADDIAIKLWEYGSQLVKASSTTNYKITILDENGNKHYTTGTMYKNSERIFLADWSLVNLLQSNKQLQIYIQENSSYGVNSTYLFTITNGNFNSVYSDFYYEYMN